MEENRSMFNEFVGPNPTYIVGVSQLELCYFSIDFDTDSFESR